MTPSERQAARECASDSECLVLAQWCEQALDALDAMEARALDAECERDKRPLKSERQALCRALDARDALLREALERIEVEWGFCGYPNHAPQTDGPCLKCQIRAILGET